MSVYFVRDKSTGFIKIGYSSNPEERVKQLHGQGELELLHVINGWYIEERKLHRKFDKYRIKKGKKNRGEWFVAGDELIDFIEEKKTIKTLEEKCFEKGVKAAEEAYKEWSYGGRLPSFIQATCDFHCFDRPKEVRTYYPPMILPNGADIRRYKVEYIYDEDDFYVKDYVDSKDQYERYEAYYSESFENGWNSVLGNQFW